LEEKDIIHQLKSGNEEAFRVLVDSYKDRIYNLCYGYVRNESDAEDLVQEVFIEVYRSVNNFSENSGIGTWIYRIAVNKALEMIRKAKRKKRWGYVFSLFGKEESVGDVHKDEVHPGVMLENKERAGVLFSKIDELPEKQKTAFLLHKVEGQSYAEIAGIMHTTVSSVESLLHRAKTNLRRSLYQYYKS